MKPVFSQTVACGILVGFLLILPWIGWKLSKAGLEEREFNAVSERSMGILGMAFLGLLLFNFTWHIWPLFGGTMGCVFVVLFYVSISTVLKASKSS